MRFFILVLLTAKLFCQLPSVPVYQVVNFNNRFGLELFSEIRKKEGNLILATYAVSSGFAIAYLGTKGDTQKEMGKIFHYPLNPNYMGETFKRINAGLKSDKNLKLASSLWVDQSLQVPDEFKALANQYYEGYFNIVDFQFKLDSSRFDINSWVSKITNKRIPNVLEISDVGSNTKIIVLCEMYLQAPWATPFNSRDTSSINFFVNNTRQVRVTMMSKVDQFPYFEDEKVKVVEIPYSTSNSEAAKLSMLVVVPKAVQGLEEVEKLLGIELYNSWINGVTMQTVNLKLPRFRMNSLYTFDETLKKLGLNSPFSDTADFSAMTESKVSLSKSVQKAFFQVDERGTDVPSGVYANPSKFKVEEGTSVRDMLCDRPFLYFVFDNTSSQLLFIGRCTQP